MTISARFDLFIREIRPTEDHIAEANRQTQYMIDRLHDRVADDGTFRLVKILRAGSNAKFTSLRKTATNRFDVDLGAYYSGEGARREQLDNLLEFTRNRLVEVYPQKDAQDIEKLSSAVRVKFTTGIQLWVDVAPIICDDTLAIDNAGWIPRPDGWRLTSVTAHNQFVSRRTAESNKVAGPVRFNGVVRLVKWWNNRQGDLVQPSILCEFLAAAAVRETGVTAEWQTSLRQVFNFLRKHSFAAPIVFDDTYDPRKVDIPGDAVVVLDSVNPRNNVTAVWSSKTRDKFLDRVQEAYDAAVAARSAECDGDEDEAVDHWCRVFGQDFRTFSEEKES